MRERFVVGRRSCRKPFCCMVYWSTNTLCLSAASVKQFLLPAERWRVVDAPSWRPDAASCQAASSALLGRDRCEKDPFAHPRTNSLVQGTSLFRRSAGISARGVDERWGEIQQKRGINTPTIVFAPSDTGKIGKVYSEQIDHADPRADRSDGRDCLEVRVVAMRGEKHEFVHAVAFPRSEQIVEHPVERLLPERDAGRIFRLRHSVDAVLDGGRPKHSEFR